MWPFPLKWARRSSAEENWGVLSLKLWVLKQAAFLLTSPLDLLITLVDDPREWVLLLLPRGPADHLGPLGERRGAVIRLVISVLPSSTHANLEAATPSPDVKPPVDGRSSAVITVSVRFRLNFGRAAPIRVERTNRSGCSSGVGHLRLTNVRPTVAESFTRLDYNLQHQMIIAISID